MLETSQDIFYIVLAFSILWFTIFLSWAVFYLAMIFRQTNITIREFRNKLNFLDTLLKTIKDKLESSSSHLAFLVEAVREAVRFLSERSAKKQSRRR